MALIAILRNSGATMLRAPLLWFFSAVVVTSDFVSLEGNTTVWLACLSLLLIPITVLAQAGQIRAVQLRHEGSHTSISQIIRHGAGRMRSLIVVMVAGLLLMLGLTGPLLFVARSLLPQLPRPEMLFLVFAIASPIADAFMAFAQRGIVISDLPLGASLPMVFRALRNDALTVVTVVAVFGLLRYFVRIPFPISVASAAHIAGYLLALLIVEGTQSAVFTFTYLHFVQGTQQGIQSIQTIEETSLEHEPPLLSTENHMREAPATRPSNLAAFLRHLVSGPNTIRKTLVEHGPAEASIAASKFSGALFLTVIAGSLAVTCAFPFLIIASPLLSNPNLGDPLAVACAVPFVLVTILMLLSVLAAMGLALIAIFKRTEKKSRSVLALLISVLILIVYAIVAIGVMALSG